MKKCKNCKKSFKPRYSQTQQVCSWECALVIDKKNQEKKWKEKKKAWKEDLKTLSDHIKDTQKIVNKYIRMRDKDKPCVSCGRTLGEKFDAGHYYNANNHYSIRFNPDNIWGQCVHCNQYLSGNLIKYRETLLKRIGEDRLNALDKIANDTRHFTKEELIEIQQEFKQKIKEL